MSSNCGFCKRLAESTNHPRFLVERDTCVVYAGDHQFYPGYCVVVSKVHIREMHQLPQKVALEIYQSVLDVGSRIFEAMKPWKMNYASFGNIEDHLHWHVVPRYETDEGRTHNPWINAAKFDSHLTTKEEVDALRVLF